MTKTIVNQYIKSTQSGNSPNVEMKTVDTLAKGFVFLAYKIINVNGYLNSNPPYTAGHQRRVSQIACVIAEELGMDQGTTSGLRMEGMIHDIGKLAVPAEILSKPGKITDIEYSLIKTHSQMGYGILKNIQFPWPIARIVVQHHERFDGHGYPHGLRNNEILPEARILKVADSIEAIASHRPYRAGFGLDKAIAIIKTGRNSEVDPEVVDACVSVYKRGGISIQSWM